jgi:hypothetical protein
MGPRDGEQLSRQGTLSIVSVATNHYLRYWKSQAKSLDEKFRFGSKFNIFLFTDQPEDASKFASQLTRAEVSVLPIPSYGWPDATLLRYRLISTLKGVVDNDDIIMYLDSDMRAVAEICFPDFCKGYDNQVTLVQHPGYFRPPGFACIPFYLANPKTAVSDIISVLLSGGIGAWEARSSSNAFVRRRSRRAYYCGGIWWGPAQNIIALSEQLAERIEDDLSRGLVAVWHDESHLNWWATQNSHNTGSPAYCFSPAFPALRKLQPKIEAVDKGPAKRI